MEYIQAKLSEWGLILPECTKPGGSYSSIVIRGKVVYVAIQFPFFNGTINYQGRLGDSISDEDGYKAMQLCALNVLSQIQTKIGFDKIEGLNHIDAVYQAVESFDQAPKVVNGASDLFVHVLGEKGIHTRSLMGVHQLPRNYSVAITTSFTLL